MSNWHETCVGPDNDTDHVNESVIENAMRRDMDARGIGHRHTARRPRAARPGRRARRDGAMRAMLTDREVFIAALATIEISGDEAAARAGVQAHRLEDVGNTDRSRQWIRVQSAIEEIQRIDRHHDEHLN